MLKIIAGKFRSRLIEVPEEGTVPTKNRVREGLFSALNSSIPGAVVLDLFAGSGALGFESLSRGAKEAYFVDNAAGAIAILKANTRQLGVENCSKIVKSDFAAFLSSVNDIKFDICFLDPPYKSLSFYQEAINLLLNNSLLSSEGIVVIEFEGSLDLDLSSFGETKMYTYGRSKVIICRRPL